MIEQVSLKSLLRMMQSLSAKQRFRHESNSRNKSLIFIEQTLSCSLNWESFFNKGTINLFGATLDELTLKDYRESINQDSANIKLLQKEII